jgi:glutathione peroxidase
MHTVSLLVLAGLLISLQAISAPLPPAPQATPPPEPKATSIYDVVVKDIGGKDVKLEEYRGKVIMIVNVPSGCGCGTGPYYGELQSLYKTYKDRGLVVLAFPGNLPGEQQAPDDAKTKKAAEEKYKVTFPLFSTISIHGKDEHPLYKFLTEKETNPEFAGEITGHFNEFLIDRSGKIVGRFGSKAGPEKVETEAAVEKALK